MQCVSPSGRLQMPRSNPSASNFFDDKQKWLFIDVNSHFAMSITLDYFFW